MNSIVCYAFINTWIYVYTYSNNKEKVINLKRRGGTYEESEE